jgi:hypothetical protein
MRRSIVSCTVLGVVFMMTVALRAQDEATPAADKQDKKEAKAEEKQAKKEIRLTQPWRRITGLSEDQKTQIAEIHKKATDEIKAIQEREKNEIMALLTEEQKTELKTLMDTEAADRKMKAAERKKAGEGAAE